LSEPDFVELVRDEIPAHVRAELWVGDRRAWTSETEYDPDEVALPPRPSGALPVAAEPDIQQTGPHGQTARPQETT
jgi:hypothetical protein